MHGLPRHRHLGPGFPMRRRALWRVPLLLLAAVAYLSAGGRASADTASEAIPDENSVVWTVEGEEIWRFPTAYQSEIQEGADRLRERVDRGFPLSSLRVVERDRQWSLVLGKETILQARSEHSGLLRLPPRTVALFWLSRLYEALGKEHADPLTAKHTLRGAHVARGTVSWYGGDSFVGRRFANGERYQGSELVAAAKSLPFGTLVRIRNLESGRTVVVRIVDRFMEHRGRILDVSKAAAEVLGFKNRGVAQVAVEVIGCVRKVGGH